MYLKKIYELFGDKAIISLNRENFSQFGGCRNGFLLTDGNFLDLRKARNFGFIAHSDISDKITNKSGQEAITKIIEDGHIRFSYPSFIEVIKRPTEKQFQCILSLFFLKPTEIVINGKYFSFEKNTEGKEIVNILR